MRRAIARLLSWFEGLADLCNHVVPGLTLYPSFVQTSNARLTRVRSGRFIEKTALLMRRSCSLMPFKWLDQTLSGHDVCTVRAVTGSA